MMKRALLTLSLLATVAAHAQSVDPTAGLKQYASKVLPVCPAGALTFERIPAGPANFHSYAATLRSSDKYCGSQKYVLHSPKTQQVLVGTVIQLPADGRPVQARIAEQSSQLLGKQMKVVVAPFPLQDGLKAVTMTRDTPYGPFSYNGYTDQSEKFLIVGFRGSLSTDPARTLREQLGAATAVRRGSNAKVEILEISDFQCPTCARAHEKVEPIIRQNLSKITYARIDLPLFEHHEWAIPAAMGARAIQSVAPAKYWQYVDWIFTNQEAIGKRNFDQVLREYAEDNDIPWAPLQKIYSSAVERKALLDQVSRAFSAGIASTPTFVINGQIMGFGPEGSFTIEAIKKAVGSKAVAAKKSK